MAGNISLGSTQKTGEGDAFIYDNSGANRNIGILAQQNAQEQQQKAAVETQKKKQDYDTKKAFYDNLSSINTIGIRPQDVDFVNQRIAKILEYTNDAKMQGKNPLDMSNSTEYMKLMTDLNSLDAYASGSKSLFKEDNAYINDINTNKDGMFDFGKSMEAYEERSKMPLDQAINFSLKPVLQKFNGQAFLTKNLTPTLLKTITPYLKVYSDKTAQADAQLQLDGVSERYTPIIDQMLFSTGKYTEDEIPEQRDKYLKSLGFKALYDDNKDVKEDLSKVKEDNLVAYRNAMIALKKDMVKVAQRNASSTEKKTAQSETVPINIASIYDRVIAGDGNAVAAFNSAMNLVDGDGAGQIVAVKKGDGTKKFNKTTGQYIVSDPNKTYVITKINGENVWNATDDASKQSFVDGVFGTNLNKQSQIEMNSGKTVKPFAYDTDKQNTVNSKNSSSSSSKDKISSSSSSTTPASKKSILKKGYNPTTNQTQIIYTDGTKEIVNGKQ